MSVIDQSQIVDDVLTMLSLNSPSDNSLIQRVTLIVSGVTQSLSLRLGGVPVPEELGYIVRDVSLSRYNRLGSEGVSSHSVEGETMSWTKDDFEPYSLDISSWLAQQKPPTGGTGIVRFL